MIELVLRFLFHFPGHRKEVDDALRSYRHEDPTVLALGSSHARTFDSVASRVAATTDSSVTLLAVPLEFGKLTGYWWVLKHRLAPLIDERDAAGSKVRPSLRHAILITAWWDSCHNDPFTLNIPARAWGLDDYARDVLHNGLTNYNRAYLSAHWSGLLSSSALIRNRAGAWIPGAVRERFLTAEQRQAHDARQTAEWVDMVEKGTECIANPAQMAALDSILDFFQARALPVTVLLYPLKPGTLSPEAQTTTLSRYAAIMHGISVARDFELIDATTRSPLSDADFSADYDHLRPSGDGHFAEWALAGPFSYLTDSMPINASSAGATQ